jgi:hypothetical protein
MKLPKLSIFAAALLATILGHSPYVPAADLEYDPRLNPGIDGDALVDLLVIECVALLKVSPTASQSMNS